MPATALAADGIELYVGGQQITESGCHANQNGTWTKVEGTGPSSGQFYYDAATATLTLNEAKIVNYQDVTVGGGFTYPGSVIAFSQSADVSLTIAVSQGTSNITGAGGIRVMSEAGDASLSISGPGSLKVNVDTNDSGISLIGSKNVNLNIDGADVKTLAAYYYGVDLHAGDGFKAAAVVNNGKLTAGGSGGIGIYYRWTNASDSGTSSLTVSGNAVVDTRDSKISIASQASEVQVSAGSDGNGGIVFDGKSGGKLEGTTTGNGTLKIAPTITTQPQDVEVKENETATFTVKVTGTEPLSYRWQQSTDNGNSWTDIASETNATYTTGKTTMDMSGTQYRCVVKNSIDEVTSDAALLTVKHNLVKTEYKAPTCTVNGNEEYWICEKCGNYFSDANGDTEIEKDSWIISAINHSWNDAVYTWSDDGSTCTATRTCKNDSTHTETSKATVTGAQTKAPTCTEKGETTYKATFEGDWAMTQTKVLADIPATGHSYENGKCTVCSAVDPAFKAMIIEGANGKWQKGSEDAPSSNAAFADFLKVQVDGKDLDASSYAVKEGSTVVALNASYLETLPVGKHTLAIVSDTGIAETEFTVVAAEKQVVDDESANDKAASDGDKESLAKTGDDSMLPITVLSILAVVSIATGVFALRRSRI